MAILKPNVSNSTVVNATASFIIVDLFSTSDTVILSENTPQHRVIFPRLVTITDNTVIGDIAGRPGDTIKGELTQIVESSVLEIIG